MTAMRRPTDERRRLRAPAAIFIGPALVLALALTACSQTSAGVRTLTPTTSATPAGTSTPAPTAAGGPVLVPGGTAAQNLAYFDKVNRATIAADAGAQGRAFIDALVAAGFVKSDMQLTPDTTTIGLKANSIQFSVLLGDTCLIGQYGADAGGYQSTTSAALATGGCLIGQTRPIDW